MGVRDRIRLELYNTLRFAPWSRNITARLMLNRNRNPLQSSPVKQGEKIHNLCKAARICPAKSALHRIETEIIAAVDALDYSRLDWDNTFPGSVKPIIEKGIILKPKISDDEKGVLFISFEDHWLRLFRHADIEKLARDYHLVLSTTWSPPHDFAFLLATRLWPQTVFHIQSHLDDVPVFARLSTNISTIPLLASNWVHPGIFTEDKDAQKKYDLVMLANYSVYKRHWLLFKMISRMNPRPKVLLIGRPWESRTEETIRSEARLYGVEDSLVFKTNLSDDELVRSIQESRLSIITSGNEGSCVAVVESMFLGVPVTIFEEAVIGSKAFINKRTGGVLPAVNPHKKLRELIDCAGTCDPRAWALENRVDCLGSTKVLNNHLRQTVTARGESWSRDICRQHWRPNPAYFHEADHETMAPFYDSFRETYGVGLRRPEFYGHLVRDAAFDR